MADTAPSQEVKKRDQHRPAQRPAQQHKAGNTRADQVADPQKDGGQLKANCGLVQAGEAPEDRLLPQVQPFHRELISRAQADPDENRPRAGSAGVASDQHLGAGCALGKGQSIVLTDCQAVTQGDHHQNTEQAPGHAQQEDQQPTRVETEEDQGWHGEDHPCGQGFAGRSDRVNDVVLQDRTASQDASQYGHRDHR